MVIDIVTELVLNTRIWSKAVAVFTFNLLPLLPLLDFGEKRATVFNLSTALPFLSLLDLTRSGVGG